MNTLKLQLVRPAAAVLALSSALILPAVADDPPATFQHVVGNGITNYTVDFSLHSVRGPNFSIQVQQPDGSFLNHTSAPVRTYIGTVQGLPGAIASGLVRSNGQIYYHVLFEDGTDWINEGGSTLGGPAAWSPNWPDYVTGPGGGGTNVWAAELGVDVPYAYYALNTNVDAALEMVEHCVNTVDLLYLRDACITHRLGRVVVRAASTQDPYFGFTIVDQHSIEGNNQWNNVLPPSTHDVLLVIATEGGNGVTGGGGIGQNAYSACEHTAAGDFTGVWRHEVGHSWSLGHYDGNTPEGPTINSGNVLARMSGPEEARVLQHRSDRAAYLDNLGPYSNSIPPRASLDRAEYVYGTTNVVIDVLANDHDANGQSLSITGFDTNSAQGGTIALSAGTGPGGRDQLVYTPPALVNSQVDLFTYRIADTEGREALGNVITRPGDSSATLLGYYSLNEGTGGTAFDASGYKRDGTLSGGAAWTNGVYGGGVFFDGVDDGIYLSSPNHPTNRFTITGWIKRSGNQLPWAALVFSRGANTVMGLNFGVGQELRYHWNDADWDWDSGLVVPDNTWTFVALTVSPTEATL